MRFAKIMSVNSTGIIFLHKIQKRQEAEYKMSRQEREELDVYVIPPNFIESGKLFGGMFKLRNAIEAGSCRRLRYAGV